MRDQRFVAAHRGGQWQEAQLPADISALVITARAARKK
jgi:hypothetical protein